VYPVAIDVLKANEMLPEVTELRPVNNLDNQIEQDHRRIKRLVKLGLGCGAFETANYTLQWYEAMAVVRKGQVENIDLHFCGRI
jgi:transposase-like protein